MKTRIITADPRQLNLLEAKACLRCGKEYLALEFPPDKSRPDGRHPYCRPCKAIYRRLRHERQREADNEKAKDYYQANRERLIANVAKWKQANVVENPERKSRYQARRREYYRAHPEMLAAKNLRRRLLIKQGEHYTAAEWEQLKASYGYRCLACNRQEPLVTLEPDHARPLARGGSNDIGNIQPLCGSCNRRKGTKEVDYRCKPE